MIWTTQTYQALWNDLKKEQDLDYITFQQKLITTKYPMIGLRTPLLRKTAAKIAKQDIASYLRVSQTATFEEVMVKGFVIGKLKDKVSLQKEMLSFIPFIDNWAVCDMFVASLKLVSNEQAFFLKEIECLLKEKEVFAVRVGLVLLLDYYVEEHYLPFIFEQILAVDRDEYYIEMAKAWLLCECFIKEQEKTLFFLENTPLSFSLLSKTIQKICDSYRVPKEMKEYLKQLRLKRKELYS